MRYPIALAAAAILACSCTSPLIIQPSEAWVRASRANLEVVSPMLEGYVKADTALDPEEAAGVLALLGDWDFLIRQGEALYDLPETGSDVTPPTEPAGEEGPGR